MSDQIAPLTKPALAKVIAMGLLGLGLLALAAAIVFRAIEASTSQQQPIAAATSASGAASIVDGMAIVRMNTVAQQRNGLVIQALETAVARAATDSRHIAYGTVLDLQPLLELRGRLATARADAESARATADASRAEYERSKRLYEAAQTVSLKDYQAAQAAFLSDQARTQSTARLAKDIESSAIQQFGQVLTGWAFDRDSNRFAAFVSRQAVAVRVVLPAGVKALPPAIQIQTGDGRHLPASLIGLAAQTDSGTVGACALYRTDASLAAGASITVSLPVDVQKEEMPTQTSGGGAGAFVPDSAVVWFGGQPWIYVQKGGTEFVRRPLGQAMEADGGYVAVHFPRTSDRVVIHGAALLLSEEQKPPAGSTACKDPECD